MRCRIPDYLFLCFAIYAYRPDYSKKVYKRIYCQPEYACKRIPGAVPVVRKYKSVYCFRDHKYKIKYHQIP